MMDKELKMKLLEELMAEMDESSMSKFKKGEAIMPEEEVDGESASAVETKIMGAMKKDGMVEGEEDEEVEGAEIMAVEDEEEDEYEGSSLMKKLRALKKGA